VLDITGEKTGAGTSTAGESRRAQNGYEMAMAEMAQRSNSFELTFPL
jgi:hypothetical protein